MHGWELICVCLFYFPPNSHFRSAFQDYLDRRAEVARQLLAIHRVLMATASATDTNSTLTGISCTSSSSSAPVANLANIISSSSSGPVISSSHISASPGLSSARRPQIGQETIDLSNG
ncbi:unnamed protein product [Protopolystoma xenopodis]|uniref:MyTH4 domain-containing protein n=1 Tax=Protopolystoma xenopodis TaxID=117903 RepID=A0A3S4ZKM9_9PLAT|nr:unnamed protein product [Protopolystoma xenopodis]